MPRHQANALVLGAPLPAIPDVADLGIRVTYPTNGPDGYTTALLRLPNDYTLAVVHSPRRQWAVAQRHYVVPGTGVTDPRPLITDPFTGVRMPHGIVWDWTDGRGISSVLRALAPLDRTPDNCLGKGKTP
ncbi:hypothetical protein [Streptomyces anulatus]|uniref:hypothetical protein n=1 Tax=Streptomyces anulatus TaxID=1892 RepID=UPI001C276C87|nr:hypothetical protein [Streptomyces anulatus]